VYCLLAVQTRSGRKEEEILVFHSPTVQAYKYIAFLESPLRKLISPRCCRYSIYSISSTMTAFDDAVLSLFPQLTTHLKHLKNDPLSQLFPYDGLIAVSAVTYSRYTVHYSGESKTSRLFWSAVLGYLAYNRYDHWIQVYAHMLSFGTFLYDKACGYYAKKVNTYGKYFMNRIGNYVYSHFNYSLK
jgi:hypothetical protein